MAAAAGLPDWTDARCYDALTGIARERLAWEWLRRCEDYRSAALANPPPPAGWTGAISEQKEAWSWGLHAFEDSRLGALEARPVWRAERWPAVLRAIAQSAPAHADAFALARHRSIARLVAGPGTEHLLLDDGRRVIRMDVRGASLGDGSVRLCYQLAGLGSALAPLATLEALIGLALRDQIPDARTRRVSRRDILVLRAADALAEGANQRSIAAVLLGPDAAAPRWRIDSPSLRSRAQRLVRIARTMSVGGFWNLLC